VEAERAQGATMTNQREHDPKHLDDGLRQRIDQAVARIEGGDPRSAVEQLVLGLQHDYALFREAAVELQRNHPLDRIITCSLRRAAEGSRLDDSFRSEMTRLLDGHESKGLVLLFGGRQDNGSCEADEDYRRIKIQSEHQGYPQDPLEDFCKLYHEYGHFESITLGFWTPDFKEASRLFHTRSAEFCGEESTTRVSLSAWQSWLVLGEEIRAWMIGRRHAKDRRADVPGAFDKVAVRSINTYAAALGVPEEAWMQHEVPMKLCGGEIAAWPWANRVAAQQ